MNSCTYQLSAHRKGLWHGMCSALVGTKGGGTNTVYLGSLSLHTANPDHSHGGKTDMNISGQAMRIIATIVDLLIHKQDMVCSVPLGNEGQPCLRKAELRSL